MHEMIHRVHGGPEHLCSGSPFHRIVCSMPQSSQSLCFTLGPNSESNGSQSHRAEPSSRAIEQSHNILTTSVPVILTSLPLIFRTRCAQLFTCCLKIYRQIHNVMKLMIPRDTGMSAYQLAVHPDTHGSYVVMLVTITNINCLRRAQPQFL